MSEPAVFLLGGTKDGVLVRGIRASSSALTLQRRRDGDWEPTCKVSHVRALDFLTDDARVLSLPLVGNSHLRVSGNDLEIDAYLRCFVVLEEHELTLQGRLTASQDDVVCVDWRVEVKLGRSQPGKFPRFGLTQLKEGKKVATQAFLPSLRLTLAPKIAGKIGVKGFDQTNARYIDVELIQGDELSPRTVYFTRTLVGPGPVVSQLGNVKVVGRDGDERPTKMHHALLEPGLESPAEAHHRVEVSFRPQEPAKFASLWNESVCGPLLTSLRTTKEGRELSFLPCFTSLKGRWTAHWFVRDRATGSKTLEANDIGTDPSKCVYVRPGCVLEPLGESVGASLPGLLAHDGRPIELEMRLRRYRPPQAGGGCQDGGAFGGFIDPPAFAFSCSTSVDNEPRIVRIGALDIQLGGCEKNDSQVAALLRPTGKNCSGSGSRPEFRAQLRLPVSGISPGSQDETLGEASTPPVGSHAWIAGEPPVADRPIIIQREAPPSNKVYENKLYELVAHERSDVSVRELTLELIDRAPKVEVDERRAVVIDRTPFVVAEVTVPRFSAESEGEEVVQVANWSSRGPEGTGWQVRADEIDLRLPPQGIGEQYERRGGEGIEPGHRSQARLSPPADLRLSGSLHRQRLIEPPWNLRRLFGVAGQRLPGAEVRALAFELLYGLHTDVEAPRLMLSELFARLGAPAEPLENRLPWRPTDQQRRRFCDFRADWLEVLSQLESRLAVLELWSRRNPNGALELTEGVRNVLRQSADLRHPIAGEEPPPQAPQGPHLAGGLAGGVSWGFESQNVYAATWRRVQSVHAEISRPFFSALGGWGWQKGVFDEGRQAIYADVAMGRTFFYALERIGRIGVLWNRAKHVIIYERTVAPSLQFGGTQAWHLGRPVVRKVREFVEVLQPQRGYPEEGGAAAAAGMLLGSSFPSTRIPVDSSWGSDVGGSGWQVPLWKRGQDPRVYGKPDVRLDIAVAPDSGRLSLEVEIDDPDKLVFYTDTREGTGADSDAWEAIPGVDFIDLPIPRPNDEAGGERHSAPIPDASTGKADMPFPGAPSVEPGYGGFTWQLVPPERGVDVVGRRASAPVEAVLRNLTMQRAVAIQGEASSAAATLIRDARQELAEALGRAQSEITELVASARITEAWTKLHELRTDLPQEARDLADRMQTRLCDLLKAEARNELERAVNVVEGEIEQRILGPIDRIATELAPALTDLQSRLNQVEAEAKAISEQIGDCSDLAEERLEALYTNADGALRDLRTRLREPLIRLEGETLAAWAQARLRVLGLIGRAHAVVAQGQEALAGGREELGAASNRARTLIERAVEVTGDELAAVREQLRLAAERLDSWAPLLRKHVPSLDPLATALADALVGVAEAAEGAPLEAAAAVARQAIAELETELDQRLAALSETVDDAAVLLDKLKREIDRRLAIESESLAQTLTDLRDQLNAGFEGGATQVLAELRQAIDEISGTIPSDLCERIESACLNLADAAKATHGVTLGIVGAPAELRSAIQGILGVPESLAPGTLRGWVGNQLNVVLDGICAAVGSALDALVERVVEALERIAEVLEEGGRQLSKALEELGEAAAALGNRILEAATDLARELGEANFQIGAPDLRLQRAWGDPPKVPGLDFSLPKLGYYFQRPDGLTLPHVDISAVTGLANRIGDSLKGMSIRLPTLSLGDRLLPDALEKFELSKVFPDFGGIKLDGLFPGLTLPKVADDRVRVTHGIEKESRRAWVQAEVDVPYDKPTDILPFDPLNVRLENARFNAVTRAEAGLDGQSSSRTTAVLASTWQIGFAGITVVKLRDTTLTQENGRTKFHVDPAKVEMPGALQFLTDLMARMGLADTGLTVRVIPGSPPGLESEMLLPLPDVTLGAFSVYNLQLLTTLTLGFEKDFYVQTRFALGSRDQPFALAVSILAGGGYIELGAKYTPKSGALVASTRIGLAAGAALAFSFGPIRGGIWFLLAVEVAWDSGRGGGLSIALIVILRGEAQIFGFISVTLALRLEARYQSSGSITASGRLEITVKVGSFFKKTVRVRVRYQLAGKSGRDPAETEAPGPPGALASKAVPTDEDKFAHAAKHYVGMLGG